LPGPPGAGDNVHLLIGSDDGLARRDHLLTVTEALDNGNVLDIMETGHNINLDGLAIAHNHHNLPAFTAEYRGAWDDNGVVNPVRDDHDAGEHPLFESAGGVANTNFEVK
jgi:hypothetical protein